MVCPAHFKIKNVQLPLRSTSDIDYGGQNSRMVAKSTGSGHANHDRSTLNGDAAQKVQIYSMMLRLRISLRAILQGTIALRLAKITLPSRCYMHVQNVSFIPCPFYLPLLSPVSHLFQPHSHLPTFPFWTKMCIFP